MEAEHISSDEFRRIFQRVDLLYDMYLIYLQENSKPVAHRSASVEVFDEEDAQVVHLPPSYWDIGDSKELEVEDAMDA